MPCATVTFAPAVLPVAAVDAWPENVCGENLYKYGTEEDVQLLTAKIADF